MVWGVGKTTLAQLVFNDKNVQSHFNVKVWVHVSKVFSVEVLTRTIYRSVKYAKDGEMREFNWELDLLQNELQKELDGKNFLIILDDVWNRDFSKWRQLCSPFQGTPRSRILITTRDSEVSLMTKRAASKVPVHPLKVLRKEDCMRVLSLHVLGTETSFNQDLEDIAMKIAEKCKGLPLAAMTFAGLLRSNLDRCKWEEVSNWRILDEPKVRNGIFQTLMPSYHNLSPDIKRCFAYCSILPKNYEFEKKQLILLWMAEGLIRLKKEKRMEDLGHEYFQELVEKSLFEKSSNEPRFRMHDFIHDVALWVARGMCFTMDDSFEDSNKPKICKKARHLSYLCRHVNCHNNFEAISALTHLRTFLHLVLPNQETCNVSLQNLSKLGRLRVLSLSGYHITELPESIGNLMHLRYLDLSNTSIESIPDVTTALCKLQTLILKNCRELKKLPSMFWKLVNLRHLNIQKTLSLEGMPTQMGKLTCLQTLSDFVVGKDHCSGLKELGSLSQLRETLCISRLENVIQPRDATDTKLIQEAKLDGLLLKWSYNLDDTQDKTIDTEVLNTLQPHKDLKELTIRNYDGTEFPMWLRTPSFPNMSLLRLENCKKCTTLPPVGQLSSLKVLSIIGMAGVQKVGREFYEGVCSDPFGSLETLCFKDMEEWDDWSPCKEFPRLRELSIQNCPKLSGKLPDHLPLLEKHEINDCPLLQDRPVTRVVQDIPRAESST